jgi:GntR family transcriptional regulator/MocR family aminotransferase
LQQTNGSNFPVPKLTGTLELALGPRAPNTTLTRWLYDELRGAMLMGRLMRGMRLPSTRDFAGQHGVSRRVVVNVFEQLRTEGYLVSRVGSGTRVSDQLPEDLLQFVPARSAARRAASPSIRPGWTRPARPLRPIEPALAEFPMELWARIAARRLRRASVSLLAGGDVQGYGPLREAIADYLGSSRGVDCAPDEIVILSGVQQGLDLLARFLVKRGDSVWIEDPAYQGATAAFSNAGARLVPVPVDEDGLDPTKALRACPRPRAVYVTPAHQFPLGVTMSLERRLALLAAARRSGAHVIEDDYDSEFRFSGRPVPALRGLDRSEAVILAGSFNKVLFPSLRIGYLVLPQSLMDRFLAFRYHADAYPPAHLEAVLCDFIVEGHFGRHLRRMRELYGTRLAALQDNVTRYLKGAVELPNIQAGLNTPAYLVNGMKSNAAAVRAAARGVEVLSIDRYVLRRRDIQGVLVGFAAFTDADIREAVIALAQAFEK